MSKNCATCNGTGLWQYDENHTTICSVCCSHNKGFWLLENHYGENNGKYCCLNGCGFIVDYIIPKNKRKRKKNAI